jgi:hypothetical protein
MLTDLRILLVDTARVWWRLLPVIMAVYLLGWLGGELTLRLALIVGDLSPWLTLILFAFHFVCILGATVAILSLAGRELGIRELLPDDERTVDDRDASFTRLLAITLLPVLGMYAAFGQVTAAADRIAVNQLIRYGVLSDQQTVLGVLHDLAINRPFLLFGLLAGLYLVRRLVDLVHDRTGWRVMGLAIVLIESFFILVLVMGGVRIFQSVGVWLKDRVFVQWLVAVKNEVAEFLAVFAIDLPAILERLGTFIAEQVWPIFVDVLTAPLLWLAVAALVFGSRVLSLAEVWRKGQPYAARVPGASTFARYADKRALRRIGPPPKGVRLAASQLQQAFLGDVDDKYLPTFHSLRLVLRAGVLFLGCYIFAYSLVLIAQKYFGQLLNLLIGGRQYTFWVRWEPVFDLLQTAPFETLRLCLLAVAFRRCLELFRQRAATPPAQPAHRDQPKPEPAGAPETVGAG